MGGGRADRGRAPAGKRHAMPQARRSRKRVGKIAQCGS